MATTFVDLNGDGNNNKNFSFPSYQESDVKVEVDNVLKTTSTHYNITNYSTTGGGTVVFTSGNIPAADTAIRIYRDTDIQTASGEYEPKATFAAGSSVKATDLNNNTKQALYAIAEEKDQTIQTVDIKDGAVTRAKIFADAVDGTKIADDSLDSEHYVDGSVDLAHLSANSVDSSKIVDGSIVNADVNASAGIEISKLGGLNSSKIIVGNGSNVPSPVDMSGDITINNAGVTTIGADAVQIANISDTETSVTANSDAKIPTSKAVADYVQSKIDPIGGLEVIENKDSFPETQPAAGVIISIENAGGIVISSNSSTTPDTISSDTQVTINEIPSDLGTPIADRVGLMVTSTGSGHIYNYHKALLKEADLASLSTDMNDFANRYRVASSAPGSDNDEGDLYFDTTANKMYVHDGSAWGQVTSTGEFKILGIKDNGEAHNGAGPTFDGSKDQYDLFEGTSDASITQASQLIVVLNGVVQKPNDGSWSGSEEGFYLDGSDGIRFCDPPASGSTLFVTKCGSATTIGVPADNTITAAKTDISIVQGDLIYGDGTDSWTRLAKGTAGKVLKMNSGATAPEWADDLNTQIGGATGVDFNDDVKLRFGTGNDMEIYTASNNSGQLRSSSGIGLTTTSGSHQATLNGWNTSGTPASQISVGSYGGANTGAKLYYNATEKLQTTATGIGVTGGATFEGDVSLQGDNGLCWWDYSDNKLTFNDNTKALFGTGEDLQIFHNGSNSYIDDAGTGDLFIRGAANLYIANADGSETKARFTNDGACELYYDNTKEFETKAGGVQLNGCSHSNINHITGVSGSTTLDFSLADHHIVSLTGNATLANPSTEVAGQSGSIFVEQDGTGSRTLAYGNQFKWVGGTAPTLSTAASAVDRIDYIVRATDVIHCVISLDVK